MSRKAICIGICYEDAYPNNPAMVMKSTHSDADRMYRLLLGTCLVAMTAASHYTSKQTVSDTKRKM